MFIKIIDGYRVLLNFEREYNEKLKEYNAYLSDQTNGFYRVELCKDVTKDDGRLIIEYKGLKWIDRKGRVFIGTVPPQRIAVKVTVPPKFPLIGVRFIVEKGHVKLRYRDYRKLKSLFKDCEILEEPSVNVNNILNDIKYYTKSYVSKIAKAGLKSILWVPLISTSIAFKFKKKYNLGQDVLVDLLWYLHDKGYIRFEHDGNELWVSLKQ